MTPEEQRAWDAMTTEEREALCRQLLIEHQRTMPHCTSLLELRQATLAGQSPEVWVAGAEAEFAKRHPEYLAAEQFILDNDGTNLEAIAKAIHKSKSHTKSRIIAWLKRTGKVTRHKGTQGYHHTLLKALTTPKK